MTFSQVPSTDPLDDDPINGQLSAADANTWRTRWADVVDARGGAYTPSSAMAFATTNLVSPYTHALIIGDDGNYFSDTGLNLKVVSRSIERHASLQPATKSLTGWTVASDTLYRQTSTGAQLLVHIGSRLPRGSELTAMTGRWKGAAGHGGLPTMPTVELLRLDETGAASTLATATDGSGSVGAYEAWHDLAWSTGGVTLDQAAYRYLLRVTGESGGNYVANGDLGSVSFTFATVSYSES